MASFWFTTLSSASRMRSGCVRPSSGSMRRRLLPRGRWTRPVRRGRSRARPSRADVLDRLREHRHRTGRLVRRVVDRHVTSGERRRENERESRAIAPRSARRGRGRPSPASACRRRRTSIGVCPSSAEGLRPPTPPRSPPCPSRPASAHQDPPVRRVVVDDEHAPPAQRRRRPKPSAADRSPRRRNVTWNVLPCARARRCSRPISCRPSAPPAAC